MGEYYKDWINSPVHRHVRLFHSDLMELFSICPWWLIPLCWIPISFYMTWLATTNTPCIIIPWISTPYPLSWVGAISLLSIGFVLWTLLEYLLHRFIFHMEPRYSSGLSLQFHFLMHGQHHKVIFSTFF